jgi:hypothetical protein
MTMKTSIDTLERARLAASPSDALDLADAIAALDRVADALARNGYALDDAGALLDDLKSLRDHVAAQPFEVTEGPGRDGETLQIVDDLTPGAFADWIQTLESLAQ